MRLGLSAFLCVLAVAGTAAAQDIPEVIARVNGEDLTRSDLEAAYRSLPEQYQQMPMQQLYEPLREQLIEGKLVLERAQSEDLSDDAEVEQEIARARDAVLQRALIQQTIAKATDDDALRQAYEKKKGEPGFAFEEVKARHILLENEEDAKAVIDELNNGADFAKLAEEKSTGPSGPQGGDLGWFRKEAMVAPFAEAAFAMEPGSISKEPVQTEFGWHVIQVEDKRQTEPTFEDTAPALREELAANAVTAMVEDLRGTAEIERFGPDGQPAADPRDAAESAPAQGDAAPAQGDAPAQ